MYRSVEPQDGESGLAAHPHRFVLRGEPADAAMPPLCAHCGQPAAERVTVEKVFRRTSSDDPTRHVIAGVAVPFCGACAAQHRTAAVPPTRWQALLTGLMNFDILGAVMPALAGLFVLHLALKDLLKGRFVSSLFVLALAAMFFGIAWLQRRHVWAATEHLRVAPQGEVGRAFDFSDDVAPAFEPPRFVCTIRDGRFAAAFAALNAERVYRPESPRARQEQQRASRKLWLAVAVMIVIALLGMLFGS